MPTLEREDGTILTQSLSIMEWLEDTHPTPALLPVRAGLDQWPTIARIYASLDALEAFQKAAPLNQPDAN